LALITKIPNPSSVFNIRINGKPWKILLRNVVI